MLTALPAPFPACLQQQPQPFSAAMKQLEAAVSEKLLPADALLANRKALATLKEFSTSLSSSPSGYPPAAVKNVEFVFRWGPCVCVQPLLKSMAGTCTNASCNALPHYESLLPAAAACCHEPAWPLPTPSPVSLCRDPFSSGRLQRVRCQLKTTGGNCAQLVQQSLGQLLQRVGLNPFFYFDGEQFKPRAPARPRVVRKPTTPPRTGAFVCGGCGGWF